MYTHVRGHFQTIPCSILHDWRGVSADRRTDDQKEGLTVSFQYLSPYTWMYAFPILVVINQVFYLKKIVPE